MALRPAPTPPQSTLNVTHKSQRNETLIFAKSACAESSPPRLPKGAFHGIAPTRIGGCVGGRRQRRLRRRRRRSPRRLRRWPRQRRRLQRRVAAAKGNGNSRYSQCRRVAAAAARGGSLRKEEDEEVPPRRTRAQSLPPPPPDSLSLFVAAPTASRQTRAGVKASCLPLCRRADAAATSVKENARRSFSHGCLCDHRADEAGARGRGGRADGAGHSPEV